MEMSGVDKSVTLAGKTLLISLIDSPAPSCPELFMPSPVPPTQDAPRLAAPPALDPNADPLRVGLPKQRGYGQWIVSRMCDVRTVLTDPTTTVDMLTPKAMARFMSQQGVTLEQTMEIVRIVARAHRVPNDAERRDAIAITRLFQGTLQDLDMASALGAIASAEGRTVDVMADILRPMLGAWRATAVAIDPELGQRVEDGLLAMMIAVEQHAPNDFAPIEPLAVAVMQDLTLLAKTRGKAHEMPVTHWISPAFLALLPIAYTSVAMLAHLAETPELQETLRARPELRPGYIREVERLMNSVRYGIRQIGATGLNLGDAWLPPRSLVVLDFSAANRDPALWQEPDTCLLDRPRQPTATFSLGPLACVGGQASRQFLSLLLDAVMQRVRVSLPQPGAEPDRLVTQWSITRGYRLCRLCLSTR